ncbi:multiple epidermal growth factor-like domains protein 11 [Crassostrea angulata]|uniref:multiple epidermal growth factor-like domains protein 11 n=1 Tax=Magallana angulata TaxID=2784310 RepID=UPI0022B210AA|nr:multiple epidermal growth factor-like domains protein 11 [Crassostrea angulata]
MFLTNTCIALWFSFSSAYENLALNKPAHEEYPYNNAFDTDASKAVDGLKTDLNGLGGQCSLSASNQRTSTWWVNLTSTRSIHDIRIYYRTDNVYWDAANGYTSRFLGFSIYVSNTTNKLEGKLCYKDRNFTRSTIPAVFNTTCFVHGQYVIYYNERLPGVIYPSGYSVYAYNNLCEVEVYGCPTPGYYGINCNIPCPDVNCGYCHIETGTCQGGCRPGYKGHQCELECDNRKYGDGCQRNCGNCLNRAQCDHVIGTCLQGCEAGYKGQMCDQECGVGFYGRGCTSQCGNCRDQTDCSRFNGICSKGCLPGYRGDTCKEQCDNGTYGNGCNKTCGHCVNKSLCNHVNGTCFGGCDPGYRGSRCYQECTNNKYGDGCQTNCGHCLNMSQCHHINGTCFDGCDPGYEGQRCNQECQNRSYGYRCQRKCGHCLNSSKCDHVDGTCLQGCAEGYGGRTCNLVNLALRKPAYEEKIYIHDNVNAGNAVDGNKSNLNGLGGECSISAEKQRTATWWVNLESIYSIHNIRIYYRTENFAWGPLNGHTTRFLGFSIYVSNTTDKSEGKLCYKDRNFTRSTIPAVFNTTCFVHGQYVIYYNERLSGVTYPSGYSDYAINELCEVEVYGCPRPGYYGIDCDLPCPDVNCGYCHIQTGTCQGGCKPGYKGHQCELECQDGYFGINCARECPANCNSCNKKSGLCDLGCHPGWKGTHCTEKCNGGLFGVNCSISCGRCLNHQQCHHINGTCVTGCDRGYIGKNCTEECDGHTYGYNCQEHCGICRNGEECDTVTGVCPNGCDTGYTGDNCKEKCDGGLFGVNCSTPCGHCLKNQQCHHIFGTCADGCDSGFMGDNCAEECNGGLFGVNCSISCGRCLNHQQCHHINGTCVTGCDSGYIGNTCTEECDGHTYGYNYQEHCGICRNGEECDTVTGVCPNGCDTGYTGNNCKETCSNNTYGLLCSLTCGNCVDKQQCHHVTGKCPEGCAVGFQGEKCDKVQYLPPSAESADHPSITYSVSALLALCVIVIIFLTLRLCKNEQCYKCHQHKQPKDNKPVDTAPSTTGHDVNVDDGTAYQELNEVTNQPQRVDLGHTAVNPDFYVNVEGDNSAYQALGEVTQPFLYDTPFQK